MRRMVRTLWNSHFCISSLENYRQTPTNVNLVLSRFTNKSEDSSAPKKTQPEQNTTDGEKLSKPSEHLCAKRWCANWSDNQYSCVGKKSKPCSQKGQEVFTDRSPMISTNNKTSTWDLATNGLWFVGVCPSICNDNLLKTINYTRLVPFVSSILH